MTAQTRAAPVLAQRRSAPGWQVWLALGVVYLVWGSTYLAIRVVVRTVPPFTGAGLRFVVAAALTGGYVLVRRGPRAFALPGRQLATAALVGVLLLLGGNGLVNLGEKSVPSGLTALLIALVPLFVSVLRAATGERLPRITWLGVVLGFAGVAVLLLGDTGAGDGVNAHGLLIVGAALSWACGSLLATRAPMPAAPAVAITIESAAGGVGLLTLAAASGEGMPWGSVGAEGWLGLGYLVLFGSVLAFSAYSWLLGAAPIGQVATYAYVNPVVAVLLGALLLGERVGPGVVLGGLLVVAAVAVVVRAESASARRVRAAASEPVAVAEPGPAAMADPHPSR